MSLSLRWDNYTWWKVEDPWGSGFYTVTSKWYVPCLTNNVCQAAYKIRSLARYCMADSLVRSHGICDFSKPNPCALSKKCWRELCREGCQDPDNLNRLASSFVWATYSWSGGNELKSPVWTVFGEQPDCGRSFGVRFSTIYSYIYENMIKAQRGTCSTNEWECVYKYMCEVCSINSTVS
jgi:hypothetical protein